MRALICSTFGAYDLPAVDGLCADEIAEVAGAALWLKDEEGRAAQKARAKGKRR